MGHTINWFITGSARDRMESYRLLNNRKEVKAFNPDAVIVPGNVVPDYWPGLKVQIFLWIRRRKDVDITGLQIFSIFIVLLVLF